MYDVTDATVFQRAFHLNGTFNTDKWRRSEYIVGLLVGFADVKRGDFITNCPRMKKALELCGATVYDSAYVQGIEKFC